MAVRSKITIFNAALLRTGNTPITEGDGSPLAQALEANYPEIVRDAFEDQEYPFGKARIELTGRGAGDFGYDDAFTFPSTVIHIFDVYLNGTRAALLQESWEVKADTRELLIDARERKVEIEHIKVGLEYTWSATFARAVQKRCEAVIKSVEEETEEAVAFDGDADFQFLRAGVKASKNRSRVRIKRGGRLVRAHAGSGRR